MASSEHDTDTEIQLQQRDVAEVRGNSFMQEINITWWELCYIYLFGR
jgi:hypothetical protein